MEQSFYLEKLLKLKSNFSVKIISGVRGVGKTTLLKAFAEKLRAEGVSTAEIISIDCEADERLRNFQAFYEFVATQTADLEKFFLLVDEIDRVSECEKAINALFVGAPAEIYVTCSSELLAEKISALLPDNCDVLRMYPPSFAEYKTHFPSSEEVLQNYLHFGGLPATFGANKNSWQRILRGAAYEMLFELVEKNSLQRADIFRLLIKTFAHNIGKSVNLNQLAAQFGSTFSTIKNYSSCAIGLFRKIPRFDAKAEKFLNGFEKFYCVDNGLLSVFATLNENILIENAVCVELWQRGYDVSSVKFGKMDISFVGERDGKKVFVQIMTADYPSARKASRPLRALPSDVEKILITKKPEKNLGDVKSITLQNFLSNL